jgi:hypothetical protein
VSYRSFQSKRKHPLQHSTTQTRHYTSIYPAKHTLSWETCPGSKFNSTLGQTIFATHPAWYSAFEPETGAGIVLSPLLLSDFNPKMEYVGFLLCFVDRASHRCAPDGHLQSVTIPDAVLIQCDLLMMSTTVLETCRGI